MADDEKITELTETTAPAPTDLVGVVIDPGGVPTSRKMEWRYGLVAHDISCQVTRAASQSIPNITDTPIQWIGENYDTHGFHDNAENNTRVTIPAGYGGKFWLNCCVTWESNTTGMRGICFKIDGATKIAGVRDDTGIAYEWFQSLTCEYALNAGQYVEVIAFQQSGGALNILTTIPPLFTIRKVG